MNTQIEALILTKLQQQAGEKWNATDELIIDFILASINKFESLTIKQLAHALNISTSPISSLTNKLGYHGYSQFKYALLQLYGQAQKSLLLKQEDADLGQSLKRLSSMVNNSLTQFIKNLDINKLQLLIDHINQAQKIMILSVGFSKLTGDYLASKLQLIGKDASSIDPGFAKELYNQLIIKTDLLLVISQSGNTATLEKKMLKAHEHHKNVILLSAERHGSLATHADLTLQINSLAQAVDAKLYSGFQINAIFLSDLITLLIK